MKNIFNTLLLPFVLIRVIRGNKKLHHTKRKTNIHHEKFISLPVCVLTLIFSSCSGGGQKKVTVYSSGTIKVNDKTIELEPGTRHNEQELIFTDDKVTLTVKTVGGGDKTFDITENGVYLLNLPGRHINRKPGKLWRKCGAYKNYC
jgi:hypothetical protein